MWVDPVEAWLPEAVRLLEEVAAARERLYGRSHPDTLDALEKLSFSYGTAQRVAESEALAELIVAGWQQVVADRERQLGPDAPGTQTARLRLAGRSEPHVARALQATVVSSLGRLAAERSATLGPIHPDTIDARERHADGHRWLGRRDDEIRLAEEIAADLRNALGASDPRTLYAQVKLMRLYTYGGYDLDEATRLGERLIGEVERVLGADHPEMREVRGMLMAAHHSRGRTEEANAMFERYPIPTDDDL